MGVKAELTPDGYKVDPLIGPYAKTYIDPVTGEPVFVGPGDTDVYPTPSLVATDIFGATPLITPAQLAGRIVFVSDLGLGGSLWSSNGSYWVPLSDVILFNDSVDRALVNTVTGFQGFIPPVPILAGVLNPASQVDINMLVNLPGSASTKVVRVMMGGSAVVERSRAGVSPDFVQSESVKATVFNRNGLARQLHPNRTTNNGEASLAGIYSTTINTGADFTMQPGLAFSAAGGTLTATMLHFSLVLKA